MLGLEAAQLPFEHHEAVQSAVVEEQVQLELAVAEWDRDLGADEREAIPELRNQVRLSVRAVDRSRPRTGSPARKSRMTGSLTMSSTGSRSASGSDWSNVVSADTSRAARSCPDARVRLMRIE